MISKKSLSILFTNIGKSVLHSRELHLLLLTTYVLFHVINQFFYSFHNRNLLFRIDTKSNNHVPLKLWYDKPASDMPLKNITSSRYKFIVHEDNLIWQQHTLPLGNGILGANVFGEIQMERVSINEDTLWAGGPGKMHPYYWGGNRGSKGLDGLLFKEIRELFQKGRTEEAANKTRQLIGEEDENGFGAYQIFGELQFDFTDLDADRVIEYKRSLDLETATVEVEFKHNMTDGKIVTFKREYFISYPNNVLAIRFTNDKNVRMNIDARFIISHIGTMVAKRSTIHVEGKLEDNEMEFFGDMRASIKGGSITGKENQLYITNCKEAVFFVAVGTDYMNDWPTYRKKEKLKVMKKWVKRRVRKGVWKGFDWMKKKSVKDYQKHFQKVDIDIGQIVPQMPTNELIRQYKRYFNEERQNQRINNKTILAECRYLEMLLFQYGRYLTLASSRKDSLPPNLQGIWCDQVINVQWGSDFHTNVNFEMNYFPTFVTNLGKPCGVNLLPFVEKLTIPGRLTAGIYTGVWSNGEDFNGFLFNSRVNPFGFTAPGSKASWGWSPASTLWVLHHVLDIFLYLGDKKVLSDEIYPILKEEAFYFEKLLVNQTSGKKGSVRRLVTSPTFSPEHGPATNGNVYENTLLWQHYTNVLFIAKYLDTDNEFYDRWESILKQLHPIEIGESGQIKEWYEEKELGSLGEKNHRHISHLVGLYPLDLITRDKKEWIEAAKVSLNDRGDISTGWGMGHRMCAWARIGDGDRSYKILQKFIRKRIYANLWCIHPPFQIDGNFAATAAVAEMLLQSRFNHIIILPALPSSWKKKGKFEGLVAKGGIVVSCWWSNGLPTKVTLDVKFNDTLTIECPGIEKAFVLVKNKTFIDDDENKFNLKRWIKKTYKSIKKSSFQEMTDYCSKKMKEAAIKLLGYAPKNVYHETYFHVVSPGKIVIRSDGNQTYLIQGFNGTGKKKKKDDKEDDKDE